MTEQATGLHVHTVSFAVVPIESYSNAPGSRPRSFFQKIADESAVVEMDVGIRESATHWRFDSKGMNLPHPFGHRSRPFTNTPNTLAVCPFLGTQPAADAAGNLSRAGSARIWKAYLRSTAGQTVGQDH